MVIVLIKENERPTIPPKKKRVITRYEFDEKYLKAMNNQGFGIYAAINHFEATPQEMAVKGVLTKRNIPFLKKIKYAFADLDIAKAYDGTPRDEKERRKDILLDAIIAFCTPTKIIETSNGWQPLWKLKSCGIDTETQKKYVNILNGIIAWSKQYGGAGDDVKDVTRVLRIPGFYHMKEEPFLVGVIEETKIEYKLEELYEKFKDYIPQERPEYVPIANKTNVVFQEIDRIDFQELMIRAYASVGRSASFDRRGELVLDGRATGTFQGRKGDRAYLASSSHEPFRGNRITAVAQIINSTPKEAYAWIMKEYNLKYTNVEKQVEARAKIEKMEQPKEKPMEKYYTWGTKELTETFAPIKRNTSVVLVGETGDGKSTLAFDIAIKNAELGHKVLYLSLEMTVGELRENIARNYCGMTIAEEVYRQIPEHKQKAFEKKLVELNAIQNLDVKGIVGNESISWAVIVEFMKSGYDLVILDNLDLIEGEEKEHELDRQKRISKNILNYCNAEQVPIILLHHYNKIAGFKGARSIHNISGSAKISHNAHRIVMLRRKRPARDKEGALLALSDKEKAILYLMLDKARGYEKAFKIIYFYRGTFYDEYPPGEEVDFSSPAW